MRIYFGGINFETTQQEITQFLEEKIGPIKDLVYVRDRATDRFRGFVFVDFLNEGDGQRAINELHNQEFKGRRITIQEATPRPARPSRH